MNHERDDDVHTALRHDVAVVIPCYNAGARVIGVVEHCLKRVEQIVVVDDGSTDGALDALDTQPVKRIRFPENRGKGYALVEGFRAALDMGVRCIVVLDADGQHDPDELPTLFEAFTASGADLVIGSRSFDEAHVPWRSRFGNKTTILLTRMLLGTRIPDTQSGYRLHSRRFAEAIVRDVPGGRYDTEMEILVKAVKERFVIKPIPIKTLYESGNPSSHFNKIRDPIMIYVRLFKAAFRKASK